MGRTGPGRPSNAPFFLYGAKGRVGRPPELRRGNRSGTPSSGSRILARPIFIIAGVSHARIVCCGLPLPGVSNRRLSSLYRQAPWVLPVCLQPGTRPQEPDLSERWGEPVRVRPHQQTPVTQGRVSLVIGGQFPVPATVDPAPSVLSTGDAVANPKHLKNPQKRLAVLQRRLDRKKKGSRNRAKMRLAVARCHQK